MSLLEDLTAMVEGFGDVAGLRISAWYQPVGGPSAKVSPPRYLGPSRESVYLREKRFGAEGELAETVLLDSIQAQANHAEEALLRLSTTGVIEVPYLQLDADVEGWHIRLTSLEAPHRSRDAYFRESLLDGADFEKSKIGLALRHAERHALRPYFAQSPTDLIFGFWDSQRGGKQTRLARAYLSEIIGWHPETGLRAGGRFDPLVNMDAKATRLRGTRDAWELDEKGPIRLSEMNLGMVPPSPGLGGVSVRSVQRVAYLNGIALTRLGFAATPTEHCDPTVDAAARTALAALALLSDRAAFAGPGVFLRSGCDLVLDREELSWVGRGGEEVQVSVTLDQAIETFSEALDRARAAGLEWRGPLLVAPKPNLQHLLELAYLRAPAESE